jgi:hypothetical protein
MRGATPCTVFPLTRWWSGAHPVFTLDVSIWTEQRFKTQA